MMITKSLVAGRVVVAAVMVAINLSPAVAQGIQPMTAERIPEAVAVGQQEFQVFYSSLTLVRLKAQYETKAPEPASDLSDSGFVVVIKTPFLRAIDIVWTAKRKFLPEPKLDVITLNRDQIEFFVASATMTSTDQIESMVVKRGANIVRPLKTVPYDMTASNLFGAVKPTVAKVFTFALEAFAPTSDITLALVGKERTFEYPMSGAELALMK